MFRWLITTLVVLATSVPVLGHDYWLQPATSHLAAGGSTAIRLFVGDHFAGEEERPYQAKMTVKFQSISQAKTVDLTRGAKDGAKPVATLSNLAAGTHVILLERDWAHIKLEPKKFNGYLEHEGLGHILSARKKAGEDQTVGRERYRRYLKALIQAGDRPDATFKHRAGHRLEIVPQANPMTRGDQPLEVLVVFDGQPLKKAQVAAYRRVGNETKTQETRTDSHGRARFRIDGSGRWLIRLVHMQRCKDDPDYDWESFWAAYSFSVAARRVSGSRK